MTGQQIVFLVGMPRSGTKLLRDLLNRHPDISIFPNESHFIPPLCGQPRKYGDLTRSESFAKFYSDVQRTRFFRRLDARGIRIDRGDWFRRVGGSEIKDALVAMFECYASVTGSRIVGDKTPEYIVHVPLLAQLFPTAKFVHIMRDPRDYVVSMRKAWGKSLPRAAQRWKTWIKKFQHDARTCEIDFMELRYEDLVTEPSAELSNVCRFFGVEFSDAMLSLEHSPENLGDTRGATSVVSDNFGKWRRELSKTEVIRVESIAGQLMEKLGYATEYSTGDDNIGSLLLQLHRIHDGMNLFRFGLRQGGLAGGFEEIRLPGRRTAD